MIYLRQSLLLLAFVIASITVRSQDPIFSQFYNAPLQLNPALAGSNAAPSISTLYRLQWPGINNAYSTYTLNYDQYFRKSNSGIGLTLLSDNAGDGTLRNTKVSGIYSYNLRVGRESFVKGGLEVGFVQTALDWDKLVFGDAIDPQFGGFSPGGTKFPSQEVQSGNTNGSYLDLSMGVVFVSPTYFVGVALDHVNTPDNTIFDNPEKNYGGLPVKYSLHGGYQFHLDGSRKDNPSFVSPNLLIASQGGFTQINVGAYVERSQFFGGAWLRFSEINGDAVILSAGVKTGIFKIGYSYDYTISDLNIQSGGSHELGILFNLEEYFPKESKINDCLLLFR